MNRVGYSAKRRLRTVDLPAPEGPEMTMGRVVGDAVMLVRYVSCSSEVPTCIWLPCWRIWLYEYTQVSALF